MSMTEDQKALFLRALKQGVIRACNVKNTSPEDIRDDEPVIGGQDKLQLDSLDALELVMMVERNFSVRLSADSSSRDLFRSFNRLANHLAENAEASKIDAFIASQSS